MIKNILELFKHLFYDIIPEMYNIKWLKDDFDYKTEYYVLKPVIYLVLLVVSFFDIRVVIYRLVYIFGFMKGLFKGVFTK